MVTAVAPTGASVFTREPILSYPPAFRGLRGLHRPGGGGGEGEDDGEDAQAPPRGGLWLPPLRSRAVHSVEEARAARENGVDLAIFGHVYETPSKPGTPGRGLAMLREACEAAAPIPVFALGGVTAARVPDVRAAGAWGVGTLRELLAAEDGKAAAEAFLRALRTPG